MGLFFRRKKKDEAPPPHPTFARILNIVIVVAVVYMIGQNILATTHGTAPLPNADTPAESTEAAATASGNALLYSHYVEAAQVSALERLGQNGRQELVHETTPGDGTPLACGQTLTYRLQVLTYPARKPDPAFASYTAKPAQMRLGDADTPLHQLVQLMAAGLEHKGSSLYVFPRNVVFAAYAPGMPMANEEHADRPVILKLEALSAAPPLPRTDMPQTILETQTGSNPRLRCGGTAYLGLRVWRLDGTPMPLVATEGGKPLEKDAAGRPIDAKSGRITLRAGPGKGQLPFGIERAMEGMTVGSVRTLVVPPAYQPIFPTASAELPSVAFAQTDQILWAEITLLDPAMVQRTLESGATADSPAAGKQETSPLPTPSGSRESAPLKPATPDAKPSDATLSDVTLPDASPPDAAPPHAIPSVTPPDVPATSHEE